MKSHRTQKWLALVVLLFFILACSLSPAVTAIPPVSHDVYVDATTGDDSQDCLTADTACLTLTGGVDRASAGSTLHIAAGTFPADSYVSLPFALTIQGAGQERTFLTSSSDEGLEVGLDTEVHIQDLTVMNVAVADHPGTGAIVLSAGGTLVLARVTVRDNGGTGLFVSYGSLANVADSIFQDNAAGIVNAGGLQVTNTAFLNHSGYAINTSGVAAFDQVTFDGNMMGINNQIDPDGGTGALDVNRSAFSNSSVSGLTNSLGGRAHVAGSSFSMDRVGISNYGGVLTLENDVFSDNVDAGILLNSDDLAQPAFVQVSQTVLVRARMGIWVQNGSAQLENVTVGENSDQGIFVDTGEVGLAYGTIAYNAQGGVSLGRGGYLTSRNSIIELNGAGFNCVGTLRPVALEEANLACDEDASITADTLGLETLLAHDAGTYLYPLRTGSAAIDAATGDCPAADQRGYARPVNGDGDDSVLCDIGAYEFGSSMALVVGTSGVQSPTDTPGTLPILVIATPTFTPRPGGGGGALDYDGDGSPAGLDCNDKNPKIFPGAPETPGDGIDSNCNGDDK